MASKMASKKSGTTVARHSVRQMPTSADWTICRHEGPCLVAVRSEYDGEVMRFASCEEAAAAVGRLGLAVAS